MIEQEPLVGIETLFEKARAEHIGQATLEAAGTSIDWDNLESKEE